jgi:hypothetical protein
MEMYLEFPRSSCDSLRTMFGGNNRQFLRLFFLVYKYFTSQTIYISMHVYMYMYQIHMPMLLMLLNHDFSSALSLKGTIMRPLRDGASVMKSGEQLKASMASLNC